MPFPNAQKEPEEVSNKKVSIGLNDDAVLADAPELSTSEPDTTKEKNELDAAKDEINSLRKEVIAASVKLSIIEKWLKTISIGLSLLVAIVGAILFLLDMRYVKPSEIENFISEGEGVVLVLNTGGTKCLDRVENESGDFIGFTERTCEDALTIVLKGTNND